LRRRLLARETKSLILYKATSLLEGTTCEQRAEVKRARLMRTGQAEVCFQCEDMSIRKQGEGLIPRKIISCHSKDEIRRISISWKTNANPCDSSLRSERQVLCHTALDAVSQELSFSSITFPSSSTEGRRSSLLKSNRLDSQPFRLKMTERTHCHCEPRSGVAIQYLFQPNKILKQVQDDTIRIFRNELFNYSTLQHFNSCESSPHPSPLLKERERAWIFYTSLKDDCKKERENTITNLTPLSQCKTWRTLPC